MSRLGREWDVKLRLLGSIARSQEALARLLENVAEETKTISGAGPASYADGTVSSILREHVRAITGMQEALLRTVTGTSWRRPKRSEPGVPWLAKETVIREGTRVEKGKKSG